MATKTQQVVKYKKIRQQELVLDKGDSFFERGQFGDVKRARWNNLEVAVKYFTLADRKGGFNEELKNLSMLQGHSCIVKMHGACVSDHQPFIVLEFAPLSLEKVIHEYKKDYHYKSDHVISWSHQASVGLDYIHKKDILHRDIKPSNVLLFDKGRVLKLCDFGTAKKLEHTLTNAVGTIRYMAPEVIRGRYYTDRCDVFSFGMMVWEMLARKRPMLLGTNRGNNMAILYAMANGERPPRLSNTPRAMAELIDHCWDEEPHKRPTMSEIKLKLEHLSKFVELGKPLIYRRKHKPAGGEGNSEAAVQQRHIAVPKVDQVSEEHDMSSSSSKGQSLADQPSQPSSIEQSMEAQPAMQEQLSSSASALIPGSQASELGRQPSELRGQPSELGGQPQPSQFRGQPALSDSQPSQFDGQPSQFGGKSSELRGKTSSRIYPPPSSHQPSSRIHPPAGDQLPSAGGLSPSGGQGGQPSQFDDQPSHFDGQPSQFDGQPSQFDGQPSQFDGQLGGQSSELRGKTSSRIYPPPSSHQPAGDQLPSAGGQLPGGQGGQPSQFDGQSAELRGETSSRMYPPPSSHQPSSRIYPPAGDQLPSAGGQPPGGHPLPLGIRYQQPPGGNTVNAERLPISHQPPIPVLESNISRLRLGDQPRVRSNTTPSPVSQVSPDTYRKQFSTPTTSYHQGQASNHVYNPVPSKSPIPSHSPSHPAPTGGHLEQQSFQTRFPRAVENSPHYIPGLDQDLQPIIPIESNPESVDLCRQYKLFADEVVATISQRSRLNEEASNLESEIKDDKLRLKSKEQGVMKDYQDKLNEKEKLVKELEALQNTYNMLRKENP